MLTEKDSAKATLYLYGLLLRLGQVRHEVKACREGTRHLELVGMLIDTEEMRVEAWDKKVKKTRALAQKLMLLVQSNRRILSLHQ